MTDGPDRNREHRAFFGRVTGKRLHRGQQALFDNLLPELEIPLPEKGFLDPSDLFRSPRERFVLEIGYGGGEHLARLARTNPGDGFIGCEVFTGGIGKMLHKIREQKLENVRLFTRDALRLLEALPDASLDVIHLLYPDPWPKARHNKRRFVSPVTLEEMARTLKIGGTLHFATDIEDYANWTLAHLLRQPRFTWKTGEEPGFWHQPFAGWEPTRYEAKARRQGRLNSFYLTFVRV